MRLLTKTTLYFLLAMIPLLAAGGFYLFYQFNRELNNEVNEELLYDELQWIRYLQTETLNGDPFVLRTPELLIYPTDGDYSGYPVITDTYVFQDVLKKTVPYRQLLHIVPVNGITYQITIRKSKVQQSVLVNNVIRIMLFVFAGLFIITLLFNWLISKRLWKPFKQSLEKIRSAELQQMEAVRFNSNTHVQEFNELNNSLNAMADKIHNDYISMKEFTEDAAHEMQTPLAVAQSKMELLLQDANLTDRQVESIAQAGEAIKRLGKLNQSLLLLAKIENNQYETREAISLTAVTKKYLKLFDELIKDRQITIDTRFENDFMLNLHPLLADSLISNLLGNAVRYNYNGGRISITVTASRYSISNSSHLPAIETGLLFKRFKKIKYEGNTSNGLGLAIVKKIADTHNMNIVYHEEKGFHQFIIERGH